MAAVLLVAALAFSGGSFRVRVVAPRSGMVRMDFGDRFYVSHDAPSPWGPTDGPEALPDGVYEVALPKPLGIEFEELDARGLKVIGVVAGGNAAKSGTIRVDDELVGVTAVRAPRAPPRVRARPHTPRAADGHAARAPRAGRVPAAGAAHGQIRMVGAKFERQMFACAKWDFDTVVDAIGSNSEKFGCEDVVLQFRRAATATA